MIYVINGAPTSGKDTFCNSVLEITKHGENFSTVDAVKDIARQAGWNGEKTPEMRKMLSDLKDLLSKYFDLPFENVKRKIRASITIYEDFGFDTSRIPFFIMSREPKEIERFKNELGAKTIIVRRDEAEQVQASNSSDQNVLNYDYDIVIDNNGSLDNLKVKAKEFVISQNLWYNNNRK